jgi:hypothetical protein
MTAFLIENRTDQVITEDQFVDIPFIRCDATAPVVYKSFSESSHTGSAMGLTSAPNGYSINNFRIDSGEWKIFALLHGNPPIFNGT